MDAKTLLLDHFEKIALGAAGIVLALFLGTTVVAKDPAQEQQDNVERANKEIARKKEIADKHPPLPERPQLARQVADALGAGAPPEALPAWLFHKRPLIATKTQGVDIPEPRHFAPTVVSPRAGLGTIGLSWSPHSNNHLVVVERYVVYRAEKEPTGWTKVGGEMDDKVTSFTDLDVKPKTTYFYKVESHALIDPGAPAVKAAREKNVEIPQPERVTASEVMGPIETLKDTHVKPLNVDLKTTPDEIRQGAPMREPRAYVKIWKYFPDAKQWLFSTPRYFGVGQKIATREIINGVERDFSTDYTLRETKRLRKKRAGTESERPVDAIVVKDEKTGQEIEIDQDGSPELDRIEKNPKPGMDADEGGEGEGDGDR